MIDELQYLVAFGSTTRPEAVYPKELKANGKRGIIVTVDITAETGAATLDCKVQRKDRASGKLTDIPGAAIAQQNGIAKVELTIYPGLVAAANQVVSDVISEDFAVEVTIGGSSVTMTFTVGVALIP